MEIYKITNIITQDFYIGSAINFANRKIAHLNSLKYNKHYNKFIQNSWNKYGKNAFIFEIIESVKTKEDLIPREQFWIDTLSPTFNLCKIAGSPLGIKHTEIAKHNMSLAHINQSPEERGHKIDCNCSVCKHKSGENHWNFSKNVPEKRKDKIAKGVKRFYEEGGKHHQSGKPRTKKVKDKIAKALMIPISQYDLNNNFIRDWEGTIIAANELMLYSSGINACLKGRLKTSGKFIWKYKLN
jgi:group I intron endonuclease